MKIISIVNIKGGVGKTASAVNIAACLSEYGKRVLVADGDAQGNTSQQLKVYSINNPTISDVLTDKELDINSVIKKTEYENIDVIPSNHKLEFAERTILIDTTRSQHNRLSKALKAVEEEYDYCIIDCPPRLNMSTINALAASDEVLVPMKIDQYSLDGLNDLLSAIEEIKDEFNNKLLFRGCFITMDTKTVVNKLVIEKLKEQLGSKLISTRIRNTIKVVESTFEQIPVVFYDKNCSASIDYRNLVNELYRG